MNEFKTGFRAADRSIYISIILTEIKSEPSHTRILRIFMASDFSLPRRGVLRLWLSPALALPLSACAAPKQNTDASVEPTD